MMCADAKTLLEHVQTQHAQTSPRNCNGLFVCLWADCKGSRSPRGDRLRTPQVHQLVVHVKAHVDYRDYACSVCGRTYKWKTELSKHKARHKTLTGVANNEAHYTPTGSGSTEHPCDICPKFFRTSQALALHSRLMHSETRTPNSRSAKRKSSSSSETPSPRKVKRARVDADEELRPYSRLLIRIPARLPASQNGDQASESPELPPELSSAFSAPWQTALAAATMKMLENATAPDAGLPLNTLFSRLEKLIDESVTQHLAVST